MFKKLAKLRAVNPTLAEEIMMNGGFMDENQLKQFAAASPKELLLVRCNNGRFLCSADSVANFTAIIERDYKAQEAKNSCERDYVRDVSIPAGEWLPG